AHRMRVGGRFSRAWQALIAMVVTVSLAACAQSQARPSSSSAGSVAGSGAAPASAAWQQILAAAKKEGTVTLYSATTGDQGRAALVEPFEKAYPDIKLQANFTTNTDLIARVAAERQAGKLIPDVFVGPGTSAITAFKASGGLSALEPWLVLPEVAGGGNWLNGHLWWMDAAEPMTTLAFQGQVQPVISYNKNLVDPKQITSYMNLLDPKWKGKIVARDERVPGPGGPQIIYLYRRPDLGPKYVERLFSETNITLSLDARQMIDWLAQGRFLLGVAINSRELRDAAAQGLPVGFIPTSQLKEGADLSNGGGIVSAPTQPPHPNAAKVYLNWLLSKDGQMAWQRVTNIPSLRMDVPKDGLEDVPTPGVDYVASSVENFSKLMDTDVKPLITKALDEAPKGS